MPHRTGDLAARMTSVSPLGEPPRAEVRSGAEAPQCRPVRQVSSDDSRGREGWLSLLGLVSWCRLPRVCPLQPPSRSIPPAHGVDVWSETASRICGVPYRHGVGL